MKYYRVFCGKMPGREAHAEHVQLEVFRDGVQIAVRADQLQVGDLGAKHGEPGIRQLFPVTDIEITDSP